MKTLVALVLVGFAVGWGIYGGGPVDLVPGSRMPAGMQQAAYDGPPRQLSQLTR